MEILVTIAKGIGMIAVISVGTFVMLEIIKRQIYKRVNINGKEEGSIVKLLKIQGYFRVIGHIFQG